MPQQDPVTALKQSEKPISAVNSYTNLYNSSSNTGSTISLHLSNSNLNSNSAVFTNNPNLVQKATTLANNNHICPRNDNIDKINIKHDNDNDHDNDHSDNESAFELNWQPQVSTDNQYSLS